VPFHTPLPYEHQGRSGGRLRGRRPRGIEALQRTAGNQAVGAILARFQAEEHAEVGNRRVTLQLDGLGTVGLESASLKREDTISVVVRGHSTTAQLHAAARNGTIFPHGKLLIGATSFDLRGIVISSIEMSGELVSLELSCSGISTTPAETEDEEPSRRWDHDLPPTG
jgi:hypothetical protein